ncbi:MAG: hypothetical protein R2911_11940 [Caldilineaceae bacterium]
MAEAAQSDQALPELSWQMATSWPVALDTIFGGAQVFAERGGHDGGRFKIELGRRASWPWHPGIGCGSAGRRRMWPHGFLLLCGQKQCDGLWHIVACGLNAQQQNAWLYESGGLTMLQEYYAEKFNTIQFPAGNTGVRDGRLVPKRDQYRGRSQGLKMRIPGLGGQVMNKLGVTVQVLPGGEISKRCKPAPSTPPSGSARMMMKNGAE